MGSFDGKVVLITGASSGIGLALAREFANQGAKLVLTARREELLQKLAAQINGTGEARALGVACDVTRDGDCEKAVALAVEKFGRLDVAVANAGFGVTGLVEKLTIDDFRRQLETNVFGALRTLYAALPELKKSKGVFVPIGSVSGHVSTPTTAPYSMSKFALRTLAETLRAELTIHGVGVTLISPGFIRTEIRQVDNKGQHHDGAKDPVPLWLQMPAETAARKIVYAVKRRKRERVLTGHGKLGVWMNRYFPGFVAWAMSFSMRRGSFK
jgi:NAD(P)-dependent dehydrogenase (short-subunit alcohol dehydrogenase family)